MNLTKPALSTKVSKAFFIEDEIQRLRDNFHVDESIAQFLSDLDSKDQIYGVVRAFYILVKVITDKLSDAQGFELQDRKEHFHALINFTDFAQLRLVLVAVQFIDFESAKYLKLHREFNDVLIEVGLLSTIILICKIYTTITSSKKTTLQKLVACCANSSKNCLHYAFSPWLALNREGIV